MEDKIEANEYVRTKKWTNRKNKRVYSTLYER